MLRLEDLKQQILDSQINNLYIFYGEDYAIRKHYIKKIAELFSETLYFETYSEAKSTSSKSALFKVKRLMVIDSDEEFLNIEETTANNLIVNLEDDVYIFIYNDDITKTNLFKFLEPYVTKFPAVSENIAMEFIEDAVRLSETDRRALAYECNNLYGNILLETDKIKQYSKAKGVSEETAYKTLVAKKQMIDRIMLFDSDLFMEDYLTGNNRNYYLWIKIIENDINGFVRAFSNMYRDLLTGAFIKQYGKWTGGEKAFSTGMFWGRIKILRELDICVSYDILYAKAYEMCCLESDYKNGIVNADNLVTVFIDKFF